MIHDFPVLCFIYTEHFQLSRTDVVTSAKQGPGQGLDKVSHEDLKLVLEDDWTSGRRRGDKKTKTRINVPVIMSIIRSKPVTCTTYSPKIGLIFSAKPTSQPQFT